ncbi:hypothetical protein CGSMWGv1500E_04566 [Gardnerella vaginalis 1500E]|uniref:Uncharacterized protein n=1 Tax=Gardnerella vaginalis 1500E TaxID=698957 RepID=I4LZR0_GARVA|nr:hypothetical protein CGSMWGv1500E_04566 [Gardnerella vaginalis 1500E]
MIDLRSACIPAPPVGSVPATLKTRGMIGFDCCVCDCGSDCVYCESCCLPDTCVILLLYARIDLPERLKRSARMHFNAETRLSWKSSGLPTRVSQASVIKRERIVNNA